MSSRTRNRGAKRAASVHTVHIPRQRGRRSSQPFVVVVPERPTLTREALNFLARTLWNSRRALAPTGLALVALVLTALLHTLASWSGLVLAPAALAPVVWLALMQRRRPARGSALAGRIGVAVLGMVAFAWSALAAGFGPLAGSLELIWLLLLVAAQTAWLIVRRTH